MRLPSFFRFLGVLLALALAYAAQYLFDHLDQDLSLLARLPFDPPAPFVLAAVGLAAGALLFALAAPSNHGNQPAIAARPQRPTRPAAALPFIALALLFFNLGIYFWQGENGLVRLLWAASILLLLLSQLEMHNLRPLLRNWLSGWDRRWLPGLILLIALGLRLFNLTTLPQDLHGDMASHGLQARAILDGLAGGVIRAGWADIPMTGFLPTAATMALTGNRGLLGLRLASVIGGVLSIWGLYILLKELFNREIALIAIALLAGSTTHIHFSRIAEYMEPLPFTVWSLALLVVGLHSGRRLAFAFSGVLLAVASLMYYSGRVAIIVLLLYLLALALSRPRQLWTQRAGLGLLLAGFLVAAGPMLAYFGLQWQQFLNRAQAVVLSNPNVLIHLQNKYHVAGLGPVLWEQVKRGLLMFSFYPDSSTQFFFPHPIVDSLTAPLVALGFGYALLHPRRTGNFLLALFLLAVLLTGGILTNNAPFWPRLVMILLPALGLAALAVDRVWAAVRGLFSSQLDQTMLTLIAGGLIFIAMQNWLLYYPFAAHNGRPRAVAGRAIAALPADATVCLVPEDGDDYYSWIHSVNEREIAFFLEPRSGLDIPFQQLMDAQPESLAGLPADCREAGAVWIVPEPRKIALSRLETLFPGGQSQAHGPRRGETVLYTFQVP